MQNKIIRSLKNTNWKLVFIILTLISIVSGCDKNHRYDKFGNLIYEKDTTGHEVWFEYYDDGKLKSEKHSDGHEIRYDEHGNPTYKIEGRIEHWFQYYDDGKLKSEKHSDGHEIRYDEHGNPTHKIEGRIEHWFEYYDNGKLKSEKHSDGREIRYDEHGKATYKIEGGIEQWFEYYDDGMLKSEKHSDGSEIKYNSEGVEYEYDKTGKLIRVGFINYPEGLEKLLSLDGEDDAPRLGSIQIFGKKPNWKYKYLYDDEGFLIGAEGKATMYNSNGKLTAEYNRTKDFLSTTDNIKLYYDNGKVAGKYRGYYWYKAPSISKTLYDRKGNISHVYEYVMTHTNLYSGFTGADIEYKDGKVFRMVINVLFDDNICLVFKHTSLGTDVLCKQCKYEYNSQEIEGDFIFDFPKEKEFKYTFMDFPTINEENCEHIFHYKHNKNGILEGLTDSEEQTPPSNGFINDYSDEEALDVFISNIVDYYSVDFYHYF